MSALRTGVCAYYGSYAPKSHVKMSESDDSDPHFTFYRTVKTGGKCNIEAPATAKLSHLNSFAFH